MTYTKRCYLNAKAALIKASIKNYLMNGKTIKEELNNESV